MAGQTIESTPPRRPSLWRFLPLVLLVLGAGAVFASGAHRYLSVDTLIGHRERLQAFVEAHHAQAMLLYMAIYITAVTLSIPGAVFLTIIGGFLFGWLAGGAAAAVAATIGATGVFLIARTSIGDALLKRAGTKIQALAAGFRADAFSYLLFLRFLPIVPFWITNLAAAFFGVPVRTFVLCTMVGLIPGTYAFAVAGSGLDSIIDAQQRARDACVAAGRSECGLDLSITTLLTPQIIAALAALGVLAIAPVLVKRVFRRKWEGLRGKRGRT